MNNNISKLQEGLTELDNKRLDNKRRILKHKLKIEKQENRDNYTTILDKFTSRIDAILDQNNELISILLLLTLIIGLLYKYPIIFDVYILIVFSVMCLQIILAVLYGVVSFVNWIYKKVRC